MTEDAEEIQFHMQLLMLCLRSLKNMTSQANSTTDRSAWPSSVYPLLAQMAGTCVSLRLNNPHLTERTIELGKAAVKVISTKEEADTNPWPEIETNYVKLLDAIETPLPNWVRINLPKA